MMVSEEFNRKCTDAGVQCTVSIDPYDYKKVYYFQNLGKDPVMLTLHKADYILTPGNGLAIKSWNGEEPQPTKWFVTYDRQMS